MLTIPELAEVLREEAIGSSDLTPLRSLWSVFTLIFRVCVDKL